MCEPCTNKSQRAILPGDLSLGLQSYRQGWYSSALRYYRHALDVGTECSLAHYLIGLTMMCQDKPDEAYAEWRQACRCSSHDVVDDWAHRQAESLLQQMKEEINGCCHVPLR